MGVQVVQAARVDLGGSLAQMEGADAPGARGARDTRAERPCWCLGSRVLRLAWSVMRRRRVRTSCILNGQPRRWRGARRTPPRRRPRIRRPLPAAPGPPFSSSSWQGPRWQGPGAVAAAAPGCRLGGSAWPRRCPELRMSPRLISGVLVLASLDPGRDRSPLWHTRLRSLPASVATCSGRLRLLVKLTNQLAQY